MSWEWDSKIYICQNFYTSRFSIILKFTPQKSEICYFSDPKDKPSVYLFYSYIELEYHTRVYMVYTISACYWIISCNANDKYHSCKLLGPIWTNSWIWNLEAESHRDLVQGPGCSQWGFLFLPWSPCCQCHGTHVYYLLLLLLELIQHLEAEFFTGDLVLHNTIGVSSV